MPNEQAFAGVPTVEAIRHPLLTGLDTSSMQKFLLERTRYENLIRGREAQGYQVSPIPIKDSIRVERLQNMITLGLIPAQNLEDVTDAMIMDYINSCIQQLPETLELSDLTKAAKAVRFKVQGTPRQQLHHAADWYLTELTTRGLSTVITQYKEAVNEQFIHCLPAEYAQRIRDHMVLDKGMKKLGFADFLNKCITQCEQVDPTRVRQASDRQAKRKGDETREAGQRNKFQKKQHSQQSHADDSSGGKDKKQPPLCLHPAHKSAGIRHWLRDCNESSDEQKKRYLKELRKSRSK